MPNVLNDSLLVDSLFTKIEHLQNVVLQQSEICWIDIVSLVGTAITLICFIITIMQLYKVKSTNKQIETAVKDNNSRIETIITNISLTRAIEVNNIIIDSLTYENYRDAIVRMQELNKALIELKVKYTKLSVPCMRFQSEMEHVREMLKCSSQKLTCQYSPDETISVLQKISNVLIELEAENKSDILKSN